MEEIAIALSIAWQGDTILLLCNKWTMKRFH